MVIIKNLKRLSLKNNEIDLKSEISSLLASERFEKLQCESILKNIVMEEENQNETKGQREIHM